MAEGASSRPILASLRDFAAASFRPRTPLQRAIVLALSIKLIVVISMRVFLFSGENRVHVDETVMSSVLISGSR